MTIETSNSGKAPSRLKHVARGVVAMAATAVVAIACAATMSYNMRPPSLFDPRYERKLTEEESRQLDFELANEASMWDINTRRFESPNSNEKRARWFEATAIWYRKADLLQQMFDFRGTGPRSNEKAFNELFEMGVSGDAGAACMAAMFFQYFDKADTEPWRHSFAEAMEVAVRHGASGHPVCTGIEASLYLEGELGRPLDTQKALRLFVKRASLGFFKTQKFLVGEHTVGALRQSPIALEKKLCWQRVADDISPHSGYQIECGGLRRGTNLNEKFQFVPLTPELTGVVAKWCAPNLKITPETCEQLEEEKN